MFPAVAGKDGLYYAQEALLKGHLGDFVVVELSGYFGIFVSSRIEWLVSEESFFFIQFYV